MRILVDYAKSFLGVPYIWGGESPIVGPHNSGYDCSGLVQEIMASVGLDPPLDQTAHGLFDHFSESGIKIGFGRAGALAFFGIGKIKHVAFCIDGERMIEAGGGGRRCKTVMDAVRHRAFVRIRPIDNRTDLNCVIMPEYPDWMFTN